MLPRRVWIESWATIKWLYFTATRNYTYLFILVFNLSVFTWKLACVSCVTIVGYRVQWIGLSWHALRTKLLNYYSIEYITQHSLCAQHSAAVTGTNHHLTIWCSLCTYPLLILSHGDHLYISTLVSCIIYNMWQTCRSCYTGVHIIWTGW